MPYKSVSDLPNSLLTSMPKPASEIYRKEYNKAWEEYGETASGRPDSSREEESDRRAWDAVKNKYEKKDGIWIERKTSPK